MTFLCMRYTSFHPFPNALSCCLPLASDKNYDYYYTKQVGRLQFFKFAIPFIHFPRGIFYS